MIKRNRRLNIFSFFMILIMLSSNLTIVAKANDDVFYAQYSGSTSASWGYNPYCTFTIDEIVNN